MNPIKPPPVPPIGLRDITAILQIQTIAGQRQMSFALRLGEVGDRTPASRAELLDVAAAFRKACDDCFEQAMALPVPGGVAAPPRPWQRKTPRKSDRPGTDHRGTDRPALAIVPDETDTPAGEED
ncbi:MAG TPA: hypothetical protein VN838_12085 [Bradyrhizobium sp.]|nr:hypothetical protein [Bradyrhizobium sp.]